ncbi:MAG: HD-GYP domain-containing protein [Clostridium sp.]|uniref:HD-GYP domain-containing protein n=1 Tax=Clostridium sp. TaxID=1506 RepID=UPI002FCB4855
MIVVPIDITFSIVPYIKRRTITTLNDIFRYRRNIFSISKDILDEITSDDMILSTLLDLKNKDDYTYKHSINVAIFSLALGISLNFKIEDLKDLFIGALLHDVGKIFIPSSILLKNGPLSEEEFIIMKKHPQKGYDYLLKNLKLSNRSLIISLEHHERIEGSGYPNNLNFNEIDIFSKIVSIADVYDALTSRRSYRDPVCASDALDYLYKNSCKTFDKSLVDIFSKLIMPYPCGTIVELNTGDIGIVLKTYVNFPLRPTLKIVKSSKKKKGSILNLIDHLNIYIYSIQSFDLKDTLVN